MTSRLRPVVLALVLLGAGPARAQMLHLDPLPFFTPADSTRYCRS